MGKQYAERLPRVILSSFPMMATQASPRQALGMPLQHMFFRRRLLGTSLQARGRLVDFQTRVGRPRDRHPVLPAVQQHAPSGSVVGHLRLALLARDIIGTCRPLSPFSNSGPGVSPPCIIAAAEGVAQVSTRPARPGY